MISEIIASGIQVIFNYFILLIIIIYFFFHIKPLQNLNVLKRIGEEKKDEWAHHYIEVGLDGK